MEFGRILGKPKAGPKEEPHAEAIFLEVSLREESSNFRLHGKAMLKLDYINFRRMPSVPTLHARYD